MSPDEVRSFCEAVQPYQLRIQVRMKQDAVPLVGKVTGTEEERFQLSTEDEGVRTLRYAWVARIKNA
jgi:hypothetical protein